MSVFVSCAPSNPGSALFHDPVGAACELAATQRPDESLYAAYGACWPDKKK